VNWAWMFSLVESMKIKMVDCGLQYHDYLLEAF